MYKSSGNSKFFSALSIPSFMRDWLVMRFSDKDGVINKKEVSAYIKKVIPNKEQWNEYMVDMLHNDQSARFLGKIKINFDGNYGNEIVSAVNRAFLNRQMIVAFQNTIHNKEYIAEEHIFGMDNYVELVQFVNRLSKDKELLQRHLQTQEQWALAETSANSI